MGEPSITNLCLHENSLSFTIQLDNELTEYQRLNLYVSLIMLITCLVGN